MTTKNTAGAIAIAVAAVVATIVTGAVAANVSAALAVAVMLLPTVAFGAAVVADSLLQVT